MRRNEKVKELMHLTFNLQDDDDVPASDVLEMLVFCLAIIAYNHKVTPLSVLRLFDFWWKQVLQMEGLAEDTPEA